MKFMLITNDPKLASYAEKCGVARIFIDLEKNGKQERQGHLDTLISQHSMRDISKVKQSITTSELLVRLNPLHENTKSEVDQAIELGADLLMLPMFKTAKELKVFSSMVNQRVGIIPLVETHSAFREINSIVMIPGVSEIYIGLNDLHLDLGLKFMFEPLTNGMIDMAASIIKKSSLPFGFGGIARVGEGLIPGELVLSEHMRLGSSSVILSRAFHKSDSSMEGFKKKVDLELELNKLFLAMSNLNIRSSQEIEADHLRMEEAVKKVVRAKKV